MGTALMIRTRATVRGWRITAALVAIFAGLAGVAHGNAVRGHATAETPLAFHLRSSQRARDDARRCSRELRALAARHPAVTARALEIDGSAIMAAGGLAGLPAVTLQAIEASVANVERAVMHLTEVAQVDAAAVAVLADMGETTARAHRAADRLCEAAQVVRAATLTPPVLTRERLVQGP